MSDIKALFVYTATVFHTEKPVTPITGDPIGPGTVTLPPNVYRTDDLNISAASGLVGADFELLGGTKGEPPDPPLRAMQLLSWSSSEIRQFLSGAGDEQRI